MELDVTRLTAVDLVPELENRLDKICGQVLNAFEQGKLSQDKVSELYAEWKANRGLLVFIETRAGGDR